jgi:hypothetical protein
MDVYFTEPVGPFPAAAGAAFASFTTKQDVSPQPLPVINGYRLRLGSKIWIQSHGEFSTTGTPTLALGYYIGTAAGAITTDLALSSVITTASGAAAFPFSMEWFGTVTGTLGTAATIVGGGRLDLGTSLIAITSVPIPITQALRTVTWDTTLARAVGVSATWGTSSASNIVKVNSHAVMILN